MPSEFALHDALIEAAPAGHQVIAGASRSLVQAWWRPGTIRSMIGVCIGVCIDTQHHIG